MELVSDEGLTEEEEFNPQEVSSPQEHPLAPRVPVEGEGHGTLEESFEEEMALTAAQLEAESDDLKTGIELSLANLEGFKTSARTRAVQQAVDRELKNVHELINTLRLTTIKRLNKANNQDAKKVIQPESSQYMTKVLADIP